MAQIKAVLDTNVLLGPYKRVLLDLAQRGAFVLVLGYYGLWEFGRVAQRIGFDEKKHKALFEEIQRLAEIVDHRQYQGAYPDWLKDPDDRYLLATAIVGKAQYLVTANTRDLPPGETFGGTTIITPEDFIGQVLLL